MRGSSPWSALHETAGGQVAMPAAAVHMQDAGVDGRPVARARDGPAAGAERHAQQRSAPARALEVQALDPFAIAPIFGIARLGIIPDDAVDEPEIRIPLLGHGCTLLFMMTAMPQEVRKIGRAHV